MVPVELDLKNFLSYGTEAPPLNFDQFDVACLSGGNGEGKSALLDAMTWALWGEARKSSGKRKPDAELIRIGTRHMEVSFTFDLEGSRYRVTRSFSRSATGKTTSSGLEFQIYSSDEESYRPLTGSSQRETQGRIEKTLGLTYDTFINSAFLLQGRSDEFTNKSPSKRKEILVSILNLRRYERLEEKARDRWREAKQAQQRVEAEVERLEEDVADVSDWEQRRETVQEEVQAKKKALADLRAEEKALTETLAELDAKARERQSVASSIEELTARIGEKEESLAEIEDKIEDAEVLLADQDEIEQAYERYSSLQEEREELEDKREKRRTLEKNLEETKSTLQERRNEIERRIDRLKVEKEGMQKELEECESALDERSEVETAARRAQAARQRLREEEALRTTWDQLAAEQEEARRAIVGKRQQLHGELETLQRQIQEEQDAVESMDSIEARLETLQAKKEKRSKLKEKLSEIESNGKKVAQQIQEQEGQLDAKRDEYERAEAELHRFQTADGPTCPTCGTELTADHRHEVEATLTSTLEALEMTIQEGTEELKELMDRRTALREQYTRLRRKVDELDGVDETLATVREQHRALDEQAEMLKKHERNARALQKKLQKKTYAPSYRRRWQWCAQRKAELRVNVERRSELQNQAAQVDRYVERLTVLDERARRRDTVTSEIKKHIEKIEELEAALEKGSAFSELESQIEEIKCEIDDLDFDPERYEEVRTTLQEMEDVPARRQELIHAEKNRADWVDEKERLQERIDALIARREEERDRYSSLSEELAEKEKIERQIEEIEEEVADAEEALDEVQQTLGMLNERLEQAGRDQEALAEAREELESCKHDRQLYKHLRSVFGKHGIPSLIIEETLPEIEERANRILNRLTDGRMHVRLETLKEKQRGGTKETLDIIITDEQGIPRPYETFSGGESFRVNFALRVALAQLLADRSGVRVRTLVIDEGFGTQDEDGIERLVEAIQSIRQDFAKILVITHLQRLKQAFPVRIEVTKDPAIGSTFEVIGG